MKCHIMKCRVVAQPNQQMLYDLIKTTSHVTVIQ